MAAFWAQKNAEWQEEARGIERALGALQTASPDQLLTANRILELANKAYTLYLSQNAAAQGQVARNSAFELHHGWRKPLSSLQKAL